MAKPEELKVGQKVLIEGTIVAFDKGARKFDGVAVRLRYPEVATDALFGHKIGLDPSQITVAESYQFDPNQESPKDDRNKINKTLPEKTPGNINDNPANVHPHGIIPGLAAKKAKEENQPIPQTGQVDMGVNPLTGKKIDEPAPLNPPAKIDPEAEKLAKERSEKASQTHVPTPEEFKPADQKLPNRVNQPAGKEEPNMQKVNIPAEEEKNKIEQEKIKQKQTTFNPLKKG